MKQKTPAIDQNKPWQHGYSLEFLKGLETYFSEYNSKVRSPFAAFKKNHIAAALHDNEFHAITKDGLSWTNGLNHPEVIIAYLTVATAKVRSEITMFHEDVIGVKEKGDKVIQRFVCKPGNEMKFAHTLAAGFPNDPVWVYTLQEDEQQNTIMRMANFEFIGVKINTNADIFGVWFRNYIPSGKKFSWNVDEKRVHPQVPKTEMVTLAKLAPSNLADGLTVHVLEIAKRVSKLGEFTNHFSNYNPTNSWSALSLRGYKSDPTFISKPGVMDGKNQVEDGEELRIQDTTLAKDFPDAMKLAELFAGPSGKVERLRFMKLQPGGGELTRHTDLVEKEAGTLDDHIMRVHFPIITNDKVDFTVWNVDGQKVTVNMKVGEAWYLDLRKPHTVVNGGDTIRVHLVADIRLGTDPKTDVRRFLSALTRVA